MDAGEMILISVDDHVVEPPSMHDFFKEHLPAKYKDRAPKVIRRADGTDAWLIEGRRSPPSASTRFRGGFPRSGATTRDLRPGPRRVPTTCMSGSGT